jgi:hypothetical protein
MQLDKTSIAAVILLAAWAGAVQPQAVAAEASALAAAANTINSDELKGFVEILANDTFEGRAAGSRGGRAAAIYLSKQFERLGLTPGGPSGTSYFQPFGNNYQNILGIMEGADPELKNEYVIVGAHYDHVGYGTSRNSYGPIGYIHNGADDNASGDSTLLEVIEAFNAVSVRPKRSVIFAFWDCEESDLNGSRHWTQHPTIPRESVAIVFNLDMVGRLRNQRLEIIGSRTSTGLRRFVSEQNIDNDMAIDFEWEVTKNSDHYSFFNVSMPILMIHTGLHGDYHRPSDDPEKLNYVGMQSVARLVFRLAYGLADADQRTKFRETSRREGKNDRLALERAMAAPPGRLGIRWDDADKSGPGLRVIQIDPNSVAARGGMLVGDRLVAFNGTTLEPPMDVRPLVLAASGKVPVQVLRGAAKKDLELQLPDKPVRLGISWREDTGEPGTLIIVQVVPGSAAERVGLRAGDRVYAVNGQEFGRGDRFAELVAASDDPISLTIERAGRVTVVTLPDPKTAARSMPEDESSSPSE